ncbi:MAG: hypothetical protein JRI68_20695, partial [Deltaproteobacteria bacterium]|nr:hypothetical protein [Deltaproteobacteria bacterium]
ESALASFDAIKALYGFLQSRIVREKNPATGKSMAPPKPSKGDAAASEVGDGDGDGDEGAPKQEDAGADEEPVLEVIEEI